MAKIPFTQRTVDTLRPPPEDSKPAVWWDASQPGFGIRISPQNRRVWIVGATVGGKFVSETIGTTAVIPKLAAAKELARTWLHKAKVEGVDPKAEKKVEAAKDAREAKIDAITFGTLA